MDQKTLIIIVSYNCENFIEKCLLSVISQKYKQWFLAVADNNSQDRTVEIIREVRNFSPWVSPENFKLIRFGKNLGFSGAVNYVFNRLCKKGRFENLVLINPDMKLGSDAVGQLAEVLEKEHNVGVCGGLVLEYQSSLIQHLGGIIQPNYITVHIGKGKDCRQLKDEFKGKTDNPVTVIKDVSYVTGALLATRTDLFSRLKGFDTGYRPAYFEELDYCLKVRRAGRRVVVNPLARSRHAEAVSASKYSRAFYRMYHKNRVRCALIHSRPFSLDLLREEMKWLKKEATRDQYGPLAYAYMLNLLFFSASMAVKLKNHLTLNKLKLK